MSDVEGKAIAAGVQNVPMAVEAKSVPRERREPPLEAIELQNRLRIRTEICRFLIKSLGFSTVGCYALLFLQGFHACGFQMDGALLKLLCGSTIAQSGALLAVFTNAVWQRISKTPSKSSPN